MIDFEGCKKRLKELGFKNTCSDSKDFIMSKKIEEVKFAMASYCGEEQKLRLEIWNYIWAGAGSKLEELPVLDKTYDVKNLGWKTASDQMIADIPNDVING